MRDSSKRKNKYKHTNSPSKVHLSTDNDVDDDEDLSTVESSNRKTSVDKSSSTNRGRFWPFGGGRSDNDKSSLRTKKSSKNVDVEKGFVDDREATPELSAGASSSVSATPKSARFSTSAAAASSAKTPPTKPRKAPSRFSLRRLFYGNPLLAQPFLQATSGLGSSQAGPSSYQSGSSSSNPRRAHKGSSSSGGRFVDDNLSERRSVMRDNISSCSSAHGAAAASTSASNVRECPLCLSECGLDQFPVLRNCVHIFCLECLQTYVKIEIQEGRVNLKCPQCTELMHPNDIESLIGEKNSNLLTLYESLMLRRILAVDPDTRWCPGPNCTFAVIAQGCASCPKIDCERPGCGFSFCYHCKAEWHPNQTCDMARVQRNSFQGTQQLPKALRASSGNFSLESVVTGGPSGGTGGGSMSEVKVCPRCNVLIVKMDDGSCNHMTCAVCGAEFCWLCMKEISDLHYLSPSGCTFWGKKPWSRKKKLLWQLGIIIGAPVGIALVACISIPAMIIGIPSWVGRKIHDHYKAANKHKRNLAVVGGVVSSLILSPAIAVLAVSIGVPVLLCYVYAVVPIALCRSDGCGISTGENGGVRIDIDEDEDGDEASGAGGATGSNGDAFRRRPEAGSLIHGRSGMVANPSIGEMSLGASLSLGSGCHLERDETESGTREPDRESASNTALAGASLTGSVASSYFSGLHSGNGGGQLLTFGGGHHHGGIGGHHLNRLEVGADVHTSRKKFSLSSERLSETVSLSERSATVSLADETALGSADGRGGVSNGGNSAAASTRALAGSLLAYKLDSQSVSSCRTTGGEAGDTRSAGGDDMSLRSLPMVAIHQGSSSTQIILSNQSQSGNPLNTGTGGPMTSQPRSLSPVSCQSGDDLGYSIGGRKSVRSRRAYLDKQLSENSSLLSCEDATSERVRFDDNVSFIDDVPPMQSEPAQASSELAHTGSEMSRLLKTNKLETPSLPEETAEELAQVISPEPQHRTRIVTSQEMTSPNQVVIKSPEVIQSSHVVFTSGDQDHVTLVSIGNDQPEVSLDHVTVTLLPNNAEEEQKSHV